MSKRADYVLLGGGVASVTAVMGIRSVDPDGSIIMVREEDCVPYDRPPLSKGFLKSFEMTLDDVSSKFDSFYPDNGVELMTGSPAIALDPSEQQLELASGEKVQYGKLLLATGARANRPNVPGAELAHVLRTLADAEGLRQALANSASIVIVGSGYLGLEAASTAAAIGKKVTIISPDEHPWAQFAGPETGAFIAQRLAESGITLLPGRTVTDVSATHVATDRERVDADVVLLATGVRPNLEIAQEAGLAAGDGIQVNELLQTSDPNIFSAGDVAFLADAALGVSWRAEHHLHAKWTGEAAGANMAGAGKPYNKVAYFWCDFLGEHMILRGFAGAQGERKLVGDVASGAFAELRGDSSGRLAMAIGFHRDEPTLDKISDTLEGLIRDRAELSQVGAEEVGC